MFKRFMLLFAVSLFLTSCLSKKLEFNIISDNPFLEQSSDVFSIEMLKDYVELHYGENIEPLDDVKIEGNVDLSTVGVYDITLVSDYKNKSAKTDMSISVVDTKSPEFHIFEDELLIHVDEDLDISENTFFINLVDGINGKINSRVSTDSDYNLKEVKTYLINLLGTDLSGNTATETINLRVTDIIDEKALYLYKKANVAAHGNSFVFDNNDKSQKILNVDNAMSVFTPNYREHFYWLSGLTGDYNNKQSGVKLSRDDGELYASYDESNKVVGYKQTKLDLQYETSNYRHYQADAYYEIDGEEVIKISKFVIRNIEGVWLVDEFYMPD